MVIPVKMRARSNIHPVSVFVLMVFAFSFGHLVHLLPSFQRFSYLTSPIPITETDTATKGAPGSKETASATMPLGLRWFKQGFENPWQFSTLRTGIAELEAAYKRVLKRDGKLPRLVVSFTSLPHRFDKYAPATIRLLKQQKYPPDHIYVCIPAVSRRSNDTFRVPSWISEDKAITVLRPKVDYGPATKLIPAVRAELKLKNTHARIVTIDDDNEGGWSDQQLKSLFLYSLAFEDSALGFTGWNVTCMTSDSRCKEMDSGVRTRQFSDRFYNFIRPADDYACHSLADWLPEYYSNCLGAIRKNFVGYIDVIEGYKGALYQPRFFDIEQIESIISDKVPDGFFLCDDVWFSGWLSSKNIRRLLINPAIHNDAPVNMMINAYTKTNRTDIDTEVRQPSKEDLKEVEKRNKNGKVEEGLHALGDFSKSNHDAVKWFEGHNGWTKDLWKRPNGFLYASEVKVMEKKEDAN